MIKDYEYRFTGREDYRAVPVAKSVIKEESHSDASISIKENIEESNASDNKPASSRHDETKQPLKVMVTRVGPSKPKVPTKDNKTEMVLLVPEWENKKKAKLDPKQSAMSDSVMEGPKQFDLPNPKEDQSEVPSAMAVQNQGAVSNAMAPQNQYAVSNGMAVQNQYAVSNGMAVQNQGAVSNGMDSQNQGAVSNGMDSQNQCVAPTDVKETCIYAPNGIFQNQLGIGMWNKKNIVQAAIVINISKGQCIQIDGIENINYYCLELWKVVPNMIRYFSKEDLKKPNILYFSSITTGEEILEEFRANGVAITVRGQDEKYLKANLKAFLIGICSQNTLLVKLPYSYGWHIWEDKSITYSSIQADVGRNILLKVIGKKNSNRCNVDLIIPGTEQNNGFAKTPFEDHLNIMRSLIRNSPLLRYTGLATDKTIVVDAEKGLKVEQIAKKLGVPYAIAKGWTNLREVEEFVKMNSGSIIYIPLDSYQRSKNRTELVNGIEELVLSGEYGSYINGGTIVFVSTEKVPDNISEISFAISISKDDKDCTDIGSVVPEQNVIHSLLDSVKGKCEGIEDILERELNAAAYIMQGSTEELTDSVKIDIKNMIEYDSDTRNTEGILLMFRDALVEYIMDAKNVYMLSEYPYDSIKKDEGTVIFSDDSNVNKYVYINKNALETIVSQMQIWKNIRTVCNELVYEGIIIRADTTNIAGHMNCKSRNGVYMRDSVYKIDEVKLGKIRGVSLRDLVDFKFISQ